MSAKRPIMPNLSWVRFYFSGGVVIAAHAGNDAYILMSRQIVVKISMRMPASRAHMTLCIGVVSAAALAAISDG